MHRRSRRPLLLAARLGTGSLIFLAGTAGAEASEASVTGTPVVIAPPVSAPAPADPDRPRSWRTWLGGGLGVLGVSGLGLGSYGLVAANQNAQKVRSLREQSRNGGLDASQRAELNARLSRLDGQLTTATVGWAGGALALVGATLLVAGDRASSPPVASLALGPGGWSATFTFPSPLD